MKQYLNFSNQGGKLFGAWVAFLVLFVTPYAYVLSIYKNFDFQSGEGYFIIPIIFLLVLIAFFIEFYIYKFMITGIEYKEKNVEFKGKFAEFIGIILLYFLLIIVTVGIYYPWFIKRIAKFFVNNSNYNENEFTFLSRGRDLLLIFVFALLVPMFLITTFTLAITSIIHSTPEIASLFLNSITFIIMIPYIYLLYRWLINVKFKEQRIYWKTEFFSSVFYMLGQFLISIITLGIYSPVAFLRIYKYFAERTIIESETEQKRFGYDLKAGKDFLYYWGQILLTIVTVFIYLPWAIANTSRRLLSQTFIE